MREEVGWEGSASGRLPVLFPVVMDAEVRFGDGMVVETENGFDRLACSWAMEMVPT